MSDDRQAEAGAAGVAAAGAVDAIEPFEDPVDVTSGNPDTGVGDD